MTPADEPKPDARARLLAAGKRLFARVGYERASTSMVAKEAGSSESQLVRYFGGKSGLLEAIFDAEWKPLNDVLLRLVADAPDSRTAIAASLTAVLTAFRHDPELAAVFLLEGRRIRGDRHEITVSMGFREFSEIIRRLVRRGQQDGTIAPGLDDAAVASALMGAAEGMIRDVLMAKLAGETVPFSERGIQTVFTTFVKALAPDPSDVETPKLRRQR